MPPLLAAITALATPAGTGTLAAAQTAAVAYGGYRGTKAIVGKPGTPGMPTIEMPDVPKTTVEGIEAQERGWEEVLKRARGRQGTILTSPMLGQIQPYTRKATLLAG